MRKGRTYQDATTKNLKQAYDDLVNSGTATSAEITQAREAWEESQKWSITNGTTVEIKAMKSNLAGLISDNAEALSNVTAFNGVNLSDVHSDSDYDTINFAVIAAQNQQVNNTNNDRYRQSQRNDKAVGENKK